MYKPIAIIFLTFFFKPCFSQHNDSIIRNDSIFSKWKAIHKKDFSLLVGYNQGRYGFAEIGFSINKYGIVHHPYSFDYFISNEFKTNKNTIIGPKIGVWMAGGFAMGLNMIYYTNFENSCLVFRPEIGIGIQKAKIVYGYNWSWTPRIDGINKHQLSLVYCFTLKKIKHIQE